MVLWYYGFVVFWFCGILVLWWYGFVGIWIKAMDDLPHISIKYYICTSVKMNSDEKVSSFVVAW
jgi:hypothetical protein